MASRFGAATPAQAYQAKMKWLVACLVALVFSLAGFIFLVLSNSSTEPTPAVASTATPVVESVVPQVEVVMASRRIERGSKLTPDMLVAKAVPAEEAALYIPAGEKDRLLEKFAADVIGSNERMKYSMLTDQPPVSNLDIPPGYRAVTIAVNQISGIENLIKPGDRVDVLLTYTQGAGKKIVKTLVRFSKVLSVGGMTGNDPTRQQPQQAVMAGSISLLVSEKDAKRVELARTLGQLSLTLVGATGGASPPVSGSDDDVGAADIIDPVLEEEKPCEGTMFKRDEAGKLVKYCLKNGKWTQN